VRTKKKDALKKGIDRNTNRAQKLKMKERNGGATGKEGVTIPRTRGEQ